MQNLENEVKSCKKCKKKIYRKHYSELMLNPNMELIPLCPEHLAEEYKRGGTDEI